MYVNLTSQYYLEEAGVSLRVDFVLVTEMEERLHQYEHMLKIPNYHIKHK